MQTRMAAVDAQFYWMSAKIPNDEFLLYAFDGEPTDFERAVDEVRSRAQNCPALTLRVEDGSPLTYPRWVPTVIEEDQVLLHHPSEQPQTLRLARAHENCSGVAFGDRPVGECLPHVLG